MKKIGLIEDEELSATHQAMLAEKRAEFENKEILEGKHDDLPESAFYMVGSIEEAVERAKKEG